MVSETVVPPNMDEVNAYLRAEIPTLSRIGPWAQTNEGMFVADIRQEGPALVHAEDYRAHILDEYGIAAPWNNQLMVMGGWISARLSF